MAPEHFLQLFDTIEVRAESLSAFVNQGLADDQDVVLFATPEHWKAVCERLDSAGRRIESAVADGRLTVADARQTLASLMRHGRPDPGRFAECVARTIPESRGSLRRGVRVYGELVDLLAEEGNFTAAIALEALWNDRLDAKSFELMCGYRSAHFATPLGGSALRDICGCHSRVERAEGNSLGSFLLAEIRRRAMAVRVFLRSGEHRTVEIADAARLNGSFFEITQQHGESSTQTLLTLRALDVVGAEIVRDGKVVDYVAGGAQPRGADTG